MNHTGMCPSQVPCLECWLPLPARHWVLSARPAAWPPLWPSVHTPRELAEALLGGGHEAVLNAEDDEGVVAAHGFLFQQPACQQ